MLFPVAWLPTTWLATGVWLAVLSVAGLVVSAGTGLVVLPGATGLAFLTGISFPL